MRGLILAVAVILAGVSSAFALEPVSVTIDGVSSTDTVRGIDISSQTPTDVIINTGALYREVCIQNLSTAGYLACGDSASVSTTTTSNLIGVIIPAPPASTTPATPICFSVPAGNRWYCLASYVSGSIRAVIQRGR
jgi:hypothetical protein